MRTHNRLRCLGRLTFVGDGFVRALLDTFGSEAEADRVAVEELGVSPAALRHCLMKMRRVNEAAGFQKLLRSEGSSFSSEEISTGSVNSDEALQRVLAGQLQGLSSAQRWRLAWRLFLRQYFIPLPLHYWHPGQGDREAALRAMMETETHG